MDSQDAWAITLSPEEHHLLTRLLHIAPLVPSASGNGAVVIETMEPPSAIEVLAKQGYLDADNGAVLAVDAALAALLRSAEDAVYTIVVSRGSEQGGMVQRLIHRSARLIVEQDLLDGGAITLTAVHDARALGKRVLQFLAIVRSPEAAGDAIGLSDQQMREARCLALSGMLSECRDLLVQAGVQGEQAATLAAVLGQCAAVGSVSVMMRQPTRAKTLAHLAWLAGGGGAWLVQERPAGERSQVNLVPASGAVIAAGVRDLLHHYC